MMLFVIVIFDSVIGDLWLLLLLFLKIHLLSILWRLETISKHLDRKLHFWILSISYGLHRNVYVRFDQIISGEDKAFCFIVFPLIKLHWELMVFFHSVFHYILFTNSFFPEFYHQTDYMKNSQNVF